MTLSTILAMYCKRQSRLQAVGFDMAPRSGLSLFRFVVTLSGHQPVPEDV